jgi:glycosyltransferase involved in cell wall biosynthesis
MNRDRRLRILIAAPWAPWPLNHGGRLRLYNLLRGLARHDTVTLAIPAGCEDVGDVESLAAIEVTTGRAPAALPQSARRAARPRLVSRLVRRHFGHDPAIEDWLHRNATPRRFDVAMCVGPKYGQYVEGARVPTVWDAVDDLVLYTLRDAQHAGAARWPAAARAASLYAAYERHAAGAASATIFSSTVDADYARRWSGGARVEVVSNGVDFNYFDPAAFAAQSQCGSDDSVSRIVFVGALDFPPNVDGIVRFARRIWPELHGPARRLEIVGRRPTEAVRSLGRIPGVRVVGEVADVRPWLARADVVIVPTRGGGGVKNKVLEACAMGRPVVASLRALGGLSARAGLDLLCADAPAEWVTCIEDLLADRTKADAVGRSGQRWVRAAHRWSDAAARLRDILAEAAEGRRCAHMHSGREPQAGAATAGSAACR